MATGQLGWYLKLRQRAGLLRAVFSPPPAIQATDDVAPTITRPIGHAPDATLERTNLGPLVDEAVLRAKRRMRVGVDADYDLVHKNFDVLHYLLQLPQLLERDDDLIEHFLGQGRTAKLSPHPDFAMADYVRRYPPPRDSNPYLEWLKHGRSHGELADPAPRVRSMAHVLGLRRTEAIDLVAERRRDLQQRFRTGHLGEMFARAAEIEPLIGAAWPEITRPRLQPLNTAEVANEVCAIHRSQEACGFRSARVVIAINRPRWGGGRRMEGHLAHALAAHVDAEEIVIVYTDATGTAPFDRYPDGVREIDFAVISRQLKAASAEHALVMLLRSLRADAIVNVNSLLLHRAMLSYGEALAASERIFLCLFCNDQTPIGNWVGYGLRYLYRTFGQLEGVITDSEYLSRQLAETYSVGQADRERIHAFRAPVDAGLPVITDSPTRPGRRPQIFWAGRWDRQKRVDLFLDVARSMPEADFRMWGEPVSGGPALHLPPNVMVQGRYRHIADIPLRDADAWLYTSGWDGVPSQLLEVAMTGVPIVGSLVGGTGEVLSSEDAWPVASHDSAEAYATAIRTVLASPHDARFRALSLRERMLRERTEKTFAIRAADLLLTSDKSRGDHR